MNEEKYYTYNMRIKVDPLFPGSWLTGGKPILTFLLDRHVHEGQFTTKQLVMVNEKNKCGGWFVSVELDYFIELLKKSYNDPAVWSKLSAPLHELFLNAMVEHEGHKK